MSSETWDDCATCGSPFPTFGREGRICMPCQKEKDGHGLTRADLALKMVHGFYKTRMDALVERLSKAQAAQVRAETKLREQQETSSSSSKDARQILDLRAENARLHRELAAERLRCKMLEREKAPAPAGPAIPTAMLTKLIRLVHPDRHKNSEESNEVTKFLLQLRSGSRD